jgi:hypothetical protein
MIQISEHWTVREDKATSIWVAYFDPRHCLKSSESRTASAAEPHSSIGLRRRDELA